MTQPSPSASRPLKGTAVASLVAALLTWLSVGLGIVFYVASHRTQQGCIVDEGMLGGAFFSALAGGLVGFVAVVVGLVSLIGRGRARGRYLGFAITGLLLSLVGLLACLLLLAFSTFSGAVNPEYLHPC